MHCTLQQILQVWDLRRLERDVSFQSRLTYAAQSGRITCVSPCEDDQSIASGSASGSIHVWRVEYVARPGSSAPDQYTGITSRRQLSPGEGAVLRVQQWGGLLVFATQRGGVHAYDARSGRDAWYIPSPPALGLADQLVLDPHHQHWLLQVITSA